MKRIVASLLCISLIFTQYKQAEAAVPVVVAGVAAGAVLLLAAGAVNYYSNPSGASAVATAAGNIYSNVTAYTQAVSALGQGYLMSQAAALKVTAADLLQATKNSASGLYSNLKTALQKIPPPRTTMDLVQGDILRVDGIDGSIIYGVVWTTFSSYSIAVNEVRKKDWNTSTKSGSVYVGYYKNADNSVHSAIVQVHQIDPYTPTTWPSPPPDYVPESAVPNALSGSSDGGSTSAGVASDINAMIANGDVAASPVSVDSTSTGVSVTGEDRTKTLPPYVPPATLPDGTPITPTAAPPSTTTGLGSGTTTAAQQNVTTAQQQVTNAEQQLAADPTNTALQQQLAAAQQALAAAQAALDQAKAAENEVFINPTFPNRKTLNFESWRQLVNVLPSKFPFNLVTTLGSYFEPFLAAPVAPAFELHIYQDKKLNIDLSVFDTPVSIFRWGLALLLTFGMVQLLIRWWKGTV